MGIGAKKGLHRFFTRTWRDQKKPKAKKISSHGFDYSVEITVPPLSVTFYEKEEINKLIVITRKSF